MGGEAGVAGVRVYLLNSNGARVDPENSVLTNGSGLYSLSVDPGTWRVEFVLPADRVFSPSDVDSPVANDTDSDPDRFSGKTSILTVTSGQVVTRVDAGVYECEFVLGLVSARARRTRVHLHTYRAYHPRAFGLLRCGLNRRFPSRSHACWPGTYVPCMCAVAHSLSSACARPPCLASCCLYPLAVVDPDERCTGPEDNPITCNLLNTTQASCAPVITPLPACSLHSARCCAVFCAR